MDGINRKELALKLNKNLYGQKQAGRVWNKFLVEKLQKVGFVQSKYEECYSIAKMSYIYCILTIPL